MEYDRTKSDLAVLISTNATHTTRHRRISNLDSAPPPLIKSFFDSQKDDKPSTSKMTTTQSNMDTFDDAENGMRQRTAGKHPDALSSSNKALSTLSAVSKMYDIDGDGKLDESEQAMRDMDTDNRGYLTNEKVYKVMLEQMKLQNEVFSLKRMTMAFVLIIFFLSLATLGTSFAAATLAKDTNVKNGILMQKDSNNVVGTSNVAETVILTAGAASGRRLVIEGEDDNIGYTATSITLDDAERVYTLCVQGTTINLQRACSDKTTTINVPICPSVKKMNSANGMEVYTYSTQTSGGEIATITCDADVVADADALSVADAGGTMSNFCGVEFAAGVAVCPGDIPVVNLGTAGNYAILAKSGITTTGTTAITGDIAVSPIAATAMTGFGFTVDAALTFSSSPIITGQAFASDYAAPTPAVLTTAVSNMEAAYTDAAGRTNPDSAKINKNGGLLDEVTLTPGVWTFTTAVNLNGNIYFNGNANDIFIIQIATNLVQAANYEVILQGGAQAKNIFWQVAGTVTVGAGAHMEGILLVKTAATFITGSTLNGRVLTQTACNLQAAVINSVI
jgi:hypothetical protein